MNAISEYFRRRPVLVLLIGTTILIIGFGIRHGFGLFMQPMTTELGWSREAFAFALALQNLIWGIAQPFAGAVSDRYGAGRTIAVGSVLYGIGLYMMSETTTSMGFTISAGLVVGVALAGTTNAVILGAVGRAVPESWRSLALGIVAAGGSIGQFLVVPIGQAFIQNYGWSTALVLLASCTLLMVLLAAAFTGGQTAPVAGEQSMGEALKEARGHRGYWLLTAGFFVCGFHVMFIAVHLPSFLLDKGFDLALGATALALIGFFNIIGTISWGALGGRYQKKTMLSLLYTVRSVVIAVFIFLPVTEVSVLVFSATIGFLWLGTLPLTSGLIAVIFGTRYMSTLYGIVFLSHQLGSFAGIWLGGYLYDTTGSYDMIWYIGIVLGLISAALHWPIKERAVQRLAPQGAV